MAERDFIAYQRAQDTLRALTNLPPAGELVGVSPIIQPTLEVISLWDARDQQIQQASIADTAPGGVNVVSITVPAREIWLVDAVSIHSVPPATSGVVQLGCNFVMTRSNIAAAFSLIDLELAQAPNTAGVLGRRGRLFSPPWVLHAGDAVQGRVFNPAASVGNTTLGVVRVLFRELEARAT